MAPLSSGSVEETEGGFLEQQGIDYRAESVIKKIMPSVILRFQRVDYLGFALFKNPNKPQLIRISSFAYFNKWEE